MVSEDLCKVRLWFTLRTFPLPAAVLPAARLLSWMQELSLLYVHAQVELCASEVGINVPTHSTDAEDRLAYGVLKMVLAISLLCDGSS